MSLWMVNCLALCSACATWAIPGPRGALRASGGATGDRLLSAPHPVPSSWYLRLRGCLSGSFWSPGLSHAPDPPLFHQLSSRSHLCIGVCDHHPSGTSRQEEVEVEGMRENRLAPRP